jgi:fumarate hydratase class II
MTNNTRIETDSLGEMAVPADKYWGAQTQRSLQNFKIGGEKMPAPLIRALGIVKKAAAQANMDLGVLDKDLGDNIINAAEEVIDGTFPPCCLANRVRHTIQYEHERSHRQPSH